MNLNIRLETENDYQIVENVTREAFWDVYRPGCNEHLMVHQLRKSEAHIKELAFVACIYDEIIGNIVYSKAKVVDEKSTEYEVLCMGPIGVIPQYKSKGIGTSLMKYSIKAAKSLGYNAIVIFGDPKYYNRFGFESAKKFNIQTSWGENFAAFMALELYKGALEDINGKFYSDSGFEIDDKKLELFEQNFIYKEKKFIKK